MFTGLPSLLGVTPGIRTIGASEPRPQHSAAGSTATVAATSPWAVDRDVYADAPSVMDSDWANVLLALGIADVERRPLHGPTRTEPETLSILGGLIELGSPQEPGAGTSETWWLPDRVLAWDMSPFYTVHDQLFDRDRTLFDLPALLGAEARSFAAGLSNYGFLDPVRIGLQSVYSAATTLAAVGFATVNSLSSVVNRFIG